MVRRTVLGLRRRILCSTANSFFFQNLKFEVQTALIVGTDHYYLGMRKSVQAKCTDERIFSWCSL